MCATSEFDSHCAHVKNEFDFIDHRVNGTDWFDKPRAGRVKSYEFFDGRLTRLFIEDEETGEFLRLKTWIMW